MSVLLCLQPGQMGSGRRVSPLNTVVSVQSEPTAFQEPAFHDPAEGIGVRSDGEHRYSVSPSLELGTRPALSLQFRLYLLFII